jgi:N-acetylglucosamine-6-phosphate deacetylase
MIIQSKRVWLANTFSPAQITVTDGKIEYIGPYDEKTPDVDYGEKRIVPGFIDVHTHGAYGFDTNDGDEAGLRNWDKLLPIDEGVTSFCPTTITQSPEVLDKALANVAKIVDDGYEGAEILGVNFEGPYLDMKYKGAQPEQYILDANVEQFQHYQKTAKGLIKYIALAPEHDKDLALTRYATQHGVAVAMGHTGATYQQALAGVANGARSMTHVYNGMSPYNHRALGMVGAAFRFRDVYGEIICDGLHSTPDALNNYFTAKGADYSIMISDSLRPKGLPIGVYSSGGMDIEVYPDGSAHLKGQSTLAGSTLRINRGLQVLVEKALVPFGAALNACTINPATMLRIQDRKGRLMAGLDADIVVLEDNYDIAQTYVKGRSVK